MRNCLNGRLTETVDKIKSSFETCISSNLSKLSDEPSNEIENFTTKTEISKSKETFDSQVTCLRVDRISSIVENQHTQLENVIKDLGSEEITAENKARLINKRIEQLKESFDDDFNRELFYCEVSIKIIKKKANSSFNLQTALNLRTFERKIYLEYPFLYCC